MPTTYEEQVKSLVRKCAQHSWMGMEDNELYNCLAVVIYDVLPVTMQL